MPETSAISARTDDGWTLHGDLVAGDGPPRAVAVLGHAMFANRRTMDRPKGAGLASTLASRGIAALSFDLRGHGKSGPTPRDGGRYTFDDFPLHDVPAMLDSARQRFPGTPVVVVGHSLGGLAALLASGIAPDHVPAAPVAIAALAVNMGLPRHEPSVARRLVKAAIQVAWLGLTLPRGYFDPRPFRLGSDAEPWGYASQYARICMRDRFVSARGDDYLAALGRVRVPVLSVTSDGDRVLAPPPAVGRFMETLTSARVEHRCMRGPNAPGHMGLVVSERSRAMWEDVAEWVLRVV